MEQDSPKLTLIFVAINMINDLVPNGMLPLAAGLSTGTSPMEGALIITCFAALSWSTLSILAGLLEEASATESHVTLRGLWARLVHPRTAWIVNAVIASTCFMSCVAYLDFASDLLCLALDEALGEYSGGRSTCIVVLSTLVLLPLCLLRDTSALAPFSLIGVVASIYVVIFMICRSVDGSYGEGGVFTPRVEGIVHPDLLRQGIDSSSISSSSSSSSSLGSSSTTDSVGEPPVPRARVWSFNFSTVNMINMVSVGFLSHYNAAEYYFSVANTSLARFHAASGCAFAFTSAIYIASMYAGFWTFGTKCESTILLNYSPSDSLAAAGKLAIGTSLLTSFPLMFNGLTRSCRDLASPHIASMGTSGVELLETYRLEVLGLLSAVCVSSLKLPDVGAIVEFIGATCGSGIIYFLPAILSFASDRKRERTPMKDGLSHHQQEMSTSPTAGGAGAVV